MSFYLLKSTHERKETGDVILDLSQIENITACKIVEEKETFYQIKVHMRSSEWWVANFIAETEVKNELIALGFSEAIVSEFTLQERNVPEEKNG